MKIKATIENLEVTMYGTFDKKWDPWACVALRYSDGKFRNITDATHHQVRVTQLAIARILYGEKNET